MTDFILGVAFGFLIGYIVVCRQFRRDIDAVKRINQINQRRLDIYKQEASR